MDEFKFSNEENNEVTNDFEGFTQEQAKENNEYNWHNDEFEQAMSGTVSDKHALSLYRPRVKKRPFKSPVFAAIVSAILTSAICFGIFALCFNTAANKNSNLQKPAGNVLTIGTQNTSDIKNTATTKTGDIMSIPDIYDRVSPAVVSIISTSQSTNSYLQGSSSTSSGSGVIVSSDGYIVTNNHVIDGASIITVKTTANQSLDAQVVGKDERTDLAVLKVNCDQPLPFAELGDSTALRVGDLAVAIGNPLQEALESTLTVGYISAINRTMVIDGRQMTMLQTDAAINPGNSGGALINIYGQVIGINTAKSTGYDVEGLGFAIPINEAIPIIESIIEHGYVTGRPLVGITGIDVTERIAKANNLPIGVYVNDVVSGGSADKGGIKPGDVITKFDGKEITTIDEINDIRDTHKVGDDIKVELSRNGKKVTVTITLQEDKPAKEDKAQKTEMSDEQSGRGQYQIPSDFFSWFGW
ncbi:MAG: trypsin-like peptidase domain-containing protein [Clostridia bacterium]|nr:trypsin-like peptidase domain-containing protein [Clostridia bacterium]